VSELTNAESRRIVQRARFGTYLTNEFIKSAAQKASRDIPRIMADYDFTNMTLGELNKVSSEMRERFSLIWGDMWDTINNQLDPFAMDEAEFVTKLYSSFTESVLAAPTSKIVKSAINNSIMTLTSGDVTKAGKWANFVRQNINSTYSLIDGAAKIGFQEGQTNAEIVRFLRGTYNRATKSYSGGIITGKAVNRAETLVRTGVAHYSAIARDKTIAANSDLFESRILYATFDSRTSLICQGRHLKEWAIDDDNYPRLPFHFNERSVYLYRLKGEANPFTGKRSSKGAEGGQQVDGDLSTDEWLRSQPKDFVVDTLGKGRADLFLNKGFSVDKFTDMQGRTLTLKELKTLPKG